MSGGLVIVTGDGPEHRFVANALHAAHGARAVFVCAAPPRRSWRRALAQAPGRFADRALRRLYLKAIGDGAARAAALRRVLGPSSEAFAAPARVSRTGPPRDPALAAAVAALAPDVLAVYGTGIVPDAVLGAARTVALNMHTGLSPWYRGTACAFWPLVEGRPEMVGATVHECTSAVDGGRIFWRGRAALRRGDGLHAVFARAVAAGARGYVETAGAALAGRLEGEAQDLSEGREYRGDMLGLWPELKARAAVRRLSPGWPAEDEAPDEAPEPEQEGGRG